MTNLEGTRALVVGGTSGIGLAVATGLRAAGADLVVIGRDAGRLAETTARLDAEGVQLDAHDEDRLAAAFRTLGEVDHVVSMVGDSMAGGFLSTSAATMRHVLASKFVTNWNIARFVAPHIRAGGSITFTAGTGGRPHEISATYVANAGIAALVAGLAVEMAPRARVNAVAPTFLGRATAFWRDVDPQELGAQEEGFAKASPLGRIATVDEVAQVYLMALSNGYLTGQVLAVDGGIMLA